jgi:hypothetical protein
MKHALAILLLAALGAGTGALQAEVVRPAPDIKWVDASGKQQSLSSFRGQPVIVVITPSVRSWRFRRQLARLRPAFERLAAQKAVFVAAITAEPGRIPSNIPFAIASDGPRVGFEFDSPDEFAIAIIGRDGNIDYLTNRVLYGQRVLDVVMNSYVMQTRLRRM